jgi:predicted Ser/Thr protein kinase
MALHYKKDGSLDMRYSSSRAEMSSGSAMGFGGFSGGAAYSPMYVCSSASSQMHYKKDGSLDMRYGSSRTVAAEQPMYGSRPPSSSQMHYKKDGSLDMRYGSSRTATTSQRSGNTLSDHKIPTNVPVTRAGIPDMRTKAAKEWVKQQAQTGAQNAPSWLPRTKDGSLDISKPVTREYLQYTNAASTSCVPNPRLAYYCQKLEDMLFRRLVDAAREDEVEMPQYEMLPETDDIQQQLCSRPTTNFPGQNGYPLYGTSLGTQEMQRRIPSATTRSSRENDYAYDIRSKISETVTLINYHDLNVDLNDSLGQGSFGIVYKGKWNTQVVAIKQLHLNKLTKQDKNSFIKEIKIMSALGDHPNLVSLHGYTLEPLGLVMEFVELGSLSYLLYYCEDSKIEAKMTDGRIKKKLILGVLLGMAQLHACSVVHGDLKPQNILISKDYIAKVTDFGFATLRGKTSSSIASSIVSNDDTAVCGTAAYMAPELLQSSSPPENSSDVYSFGVMLNEMIQEEEPYSDQFQNFAGRGPFGAVNYAKLGNRPRINATTPTFLKDFIEKCWNRDPDSRPTFEKIFKDLKSSHANFPNAFER